MNNIKKSGWYLYQTAKIIAKRTSFSIVYKFLPVWAFKKLDWDNKCKHTKAT